MLAAILSGEPGASAISIGDKDNVTVYDLDGDGRADLAIFRPSNGSWWLNRSTAGFSGIAFGANGDAPVAAAGGDL